MPLKNIELMNKSKFVKGMFPASIDFAPEEANRFIDYIVDESVLKGNAQIVRMSKPTKNVRTIGITGKVLWPDSIFDSTKYKQSTVANRAQLISKKARGAVKIHDDDLEDNIEGDAFVDHLMRMITAQIANDLEEGYWAGKKTPDGVSPLDLNGLWNGWRYRVLNSENDVTGSATILDARTSDFSLYTDGFISEQNSSAPYNWEFKFAKAIKSMPSKYKKLAGGLSGLRFFMNDQLEQDYIDSLAARSSILGDKAILGEGPLHYGKVPIVPCPLMSIEEPVDASGGETVLTSNATAGSLTIVVDDTTDFAEGDVIWFHKAGLEYKEETVVIASINGSTITLTTALLWSHSVAEGAALTEVTLDGADCMLTHKDNLMIGIQRDIKMESSREAAEESTYFFYSMRTDVLLGNPAAVVMIKNLKVR